MEKQDQRKAGLQDDHDPRDPAQQQNDQKIVKDERGQDQPADKRRAQQADTSRTA